ncbi:cytochrome P450 [Nocardia sp. NPDC046473]|uniref:cytochrome P450 n=1 Tax=Nocardia sp. NPDC046473 TaxID=3155733 RepID=UPI00340A653B
MTVMSSTLPIDRLPHAPGRLPLLGDVSSVDRVRPTQHETRLAAELGPIFQRKILGARLVVVAGARLAAQCCDESNWGRALVGPTANLRMLAPDGLFSARSSDPLWGQAHRILTPGFTQQAMRAYHDAMSSVADDLLAEWSTAGGSVDAHSAMARATVEVIGRAGFGQDLGLFHPTPDSTDAQRFVRELDFVLRWAGEATNDLPIVGNLRALWRTPGVKRRHAAMCDYVDRIVAERRAHPKDTGDLLNLMLTTVDPDTGQALPLDNVRNQVITFLVAGHLTTAALLQIALHYLASDAALQHKLADEIRARGHDYDGVAGMRLTRQMLNEVLRMWPIAPGFFRVARTDQNVGGYEIPAGRAVFVLSLAAQRDTDVWGPTASSFDPDRFDPAALRRYPDRFFKPWGAGPRSCIGRVFAIHEATVLLARILDAFVLSTSDELRIRERAALSPEPVTLHLTPRP